MAYSKNGWSSFNEIDFEYSKIRSICDGFDNSNKINRHYQKTIFQQYKASKNLKKKTEFNKISKQIKPNDHQNFPEDSTLQYFSTVLEKSGDSSSSKTDENSRRILFLLLNAIFY